MQITDVKVDDYLFSLIPDRDSALAQVESDARANHIPMVGPVEGQLLHILARSVGAADILEVGTATGYSATWLGRAVKPRDGRVTALEMSPERAETARRNLKNCGLGDTVTVVNQDAFEFLEQDRGSYDVIFVDILRGLARREDALRLLDLLTPRLRVGGLLLADNALHGGEAISPDSESAAGLSEYNRRIFDHPNLISSLVPLRDGLAVSLKIS